VQKVSVTPAGRTSAVAALVAVALLLAACGGGDEPDVTSKASSGAGQLSAQVASFDLVADRSGRFIVGLLEGNQGRLVAYGSVELTFRFVGDRTGDSGGGSKQSASGRFLPIPGQRVAADARGPRFVAPSEARGVYGADDVTFDRPCFWQVEARADIAGENFDGGSGIRGRGAIVRSRPR